MKTIPYDKLIEYGKQLLRAKGAPAGLAAELAALAVEAQATGSQTHGIKMFSFYNTCINNRNDMGQLILDPKAEPEIIKETPAIAVIDGHAGFGQLAMRLAVSTAMAKAGPLGISMVGIINSNWIGVLGTYLLPIADKGFIAQLWSHSTQCQNACPSGGVEPRFGTNPVCFAFPTPTGPIMADMSTTVISAGKAYQMMDEGVLAQQEIFMDKNGSDTNNPNVIKDGGSIHFLGGPEYGHKGFGMSLFCEALIGMSGGHMNNPRIYSHNMNLTVINPERFGGKEYFDRETGRFMEWVKTSRLRPGVPGIRFPGQRMASAMKHSKESGVPVADWLCNLLNQVAESNNLNMRL